jgi:hypothetical protein
MKSHGACTARVQLFAEFDHGADIALYLTTARAKAQLSTSTSTAVY